MNDNCPPRVQAWHFHWRFWKPKQCNGGDVRFGLWAKVAGWVTTKMDAEGREEMEYYEWEMTPAQVEAKRAMGLIQP